MGEIDFEAVRYRSARYTAADSTSLGNYSFAIAAADSADDVPALLAAYGEIKADRDNLGVALEAALADLAEARAERDEWKGKCHTAWDRGDEDAQRRIELVGAMVRLEAERDRLAAQVARVRKLCESQFTWNDGPYRAAVLEALDGGPDGS